MGEGLVCFDQQTGLKLAAAVATETGPQVQLGVLVGGRNRVKNEM